jgi:transcription elongation factor GreA
MKSITLTPEVYQNIEKEMTQLREVKRPIVVKRLAEARAEGDLSENGGYHAARSELRLLDTQIKSLKAKLDNAQIASVQSTDRVEIGLKITAELNGRKTTFVLGDREFQKTTDLQVFGPDSPLGQAILGKKSGTTSTYLTPNSQKVTVKILDISG